MTRYPISFLLIPLLTISNVHAADPFSRPNCLYDIDIASIKSVTGITDTDTKEKVFERISQKKDLFLNSVAETIKQKCILAGGKSQEFNNFIDTSDIIPIKIKINNSLFVDIPISKETFSQILSLQTHIVVLTNPSRFAPGTVLEESNLQSALPNTCAGRYYSKQYFANNTPCSDTPLSDAAKNSFMSKTDYNFALNDKLIKGELYQRTEACWGKRIKFTPVKDSVYYRQRTNTKQFAQQLKNTACAGENISVYLLYESDPTNHKYIVVDGPYIVP